jgi:hypothetical protein
MRHLCVSIFLLIGLAACQSPVPATTPPQLDHTPGAFVSVTDDVYNAGVFRVRYPEGWRVVKTSIAGAPMEVVFVSPDDELTIRLSEAAFDLPESDDETFSRYEQRMLDSTAGITLYAYAESPLSRRDELQTLFQQVLQRAQPGQSATAQK